MPVTKTAKRALRSSLRKQVVNKNILKQLEISIRLAKKSPTSVNIIRAISLVDRTAKKKFIHKNKAARIKSRLSKLIPKQVKTKKKSKTLSKSKK